MVIHVAGWLPLSMQCVLSGCGRLPLSQQRILEMEVPRCAGEIEPGLQRVESHFLIIARRFGIAAAHCVLLQEREQPCFKLYHKVPSMSQHWDHQVELTR